MIAGIELRKKRKARGFTIEQLAEETGLGEKTIRRAEAAGARVRKMRADTYNRLDEVLDLSGDNRLVLGNRYVPLEQRVPGRTALDFELNAHLYKVPVSKQLTLAPLALALLFEMSLDYRRSAVDRLVRLVEEENDAAAKAFGSFSYAPMAELVDAIDVERSALKARDIRGTQTSEHFTAMGYEGDDGVGADVFEHFLNDLASGLSNAVLKDNDVRVDGNSPGYELHPDLINRITGDDLWARRALEGGHVHIHAIPKSILKTSIEKRQEWLASKISESARRQYEEMDELISSLPVPTLENDDAGT